MPCYLFTFHAYGSWMPDRKRGYVKRHQGILAQDATMASRYRSLMKNRPIQLEDATQLLIIDAVHDSQKKQQFEAFFIATDATHVHLLVGWRDARRWLRLRIAIKSSISRRLNEEFGRREWFVEGGSRKRVKDKAHFDYLVMKYLPKHTGWKWNAQRGRFR